MFERFAFHGYRRLRRQPAIEARLGPHDVLAHHEREMAELGDMRQVVETLRARSVLPPADDSPIFILGSGWRSGSTLVQRLVASGGQCLVWGEPYDRCDLIRRMAESTLPFATSWPPDGYLASSTSFEGEGPEYWTRWIANLYPGLSELVEAHREFYRRLFASPARSAGYARWGLKEVRLSGHEALYLKWLFPEAKFIYVIRSPLNAYASYRPKRSWYDKWPHDLVSTPKAFGRMWHRLTSSFLETSEEVDALLVFYESLCSGSSDEVRKVGRFLDLELDPDVLGNRVGSSKSARGYRSDLPHVERRLLNAAVQPLASELGYEMTANSP